MYIGVLPPADWSENFSLNAYAWRHRELALHIVWVVPPSSHVAVKIIYL